MSAPTVPLDVDGPAAPPRSNGELVFTAPWESRAFSLAMALHDAGAFDWEAFRRRLIDAVAAWERDHAEGEEWSYYRCWLSALEGVLADAGLLGAEEIEGRTRELVARPAGHDHGALPAHAGREDHGHDH